MSILLSVILIVPAIVLWDSDQLASWLCIGAIALLLFGRSVCREDAKAQANWRRYWANGGPDRR